MHHLYGTASDPPGLRGLDPDARAARLSTLLATLIDTVQQRVDTLSAAVTIGADDDTLESCHHDLKRAVNDIFDVLFTEVIDYAAARERRAAARLKTQPAPAPTQPKTSVDDLLSGNW